MNFSDVRYCVELSEQKSERAAFGPPKHTVAAAFGRRHRVFSHFYALKFTQYRILLKSSHFVNEILQVENFVKILHRNSPFKSPLNSPLKSRLQDVREHPKTYNCAPRGN